MKDGHSTRAHALLSASSSDRWLNCTPSARLEDAVPNRSSSFAEEGTLAHELGELLINQHFVTPKTVESKLIQVKIEQIKKNPLYSDEMLTYITSYADYIIERYNQDPRNTLIIEERTSFEDVVPGGFGTNDAIIITNNRITVIDLKYGKGVEVSAHDNSQLKLYAYGALMANDITYDLGDEAIVELVIFQPRLDNISTFELTAKELTDWARGYVKERADLATKGEGDQVVGKWCKFCRVAATCKAMAEFSDQQANSDFKDPKLLTDEEVIHYLGKVDIISNWIKSLEAHVLTTAIEGKKWPGYKLVEGRSNRKFTDEETIIALLKTNNFTDEEILNIKLKGITDIEKLLGKKTFNEMLTKYITKPAGSPTLVPVSDKREELIIDKEKQINDDFND